MKIVERHINGEAQAVEVLVRPRRKADSDYLYPPPYGPYRFYSPEYSIFYECKTDQDHSTARRDWKSFEHYKIGRTTSQSAHGVRVASSYWDTYPDYFEGTWVDGRAGVVALHNGNPALRFGEPGFPIQGLPSFKVVRDDGGFVPKPSNLDELVMRSLKTMLPSIKAELSAINSVIELKDFKSLPKSLRNVTDLLTKVKVSGKTLREMLRKGSDGYLQAKFNVIPLVSDILGVKAALSSVESKMNQLVTQSRKLQKRHFTFFFNEFTDVSNEFSSNDPSYGIYRDSFSPMPSIISYSMLKRDVRYEPSVFHAEIEYNFNYTRYQVEHAQLLVFLDKLGINPNPQIIWNAIPWSFVVDWVLGVGQYLKDHGGRLNMEPKINIRRYLWSVKRSRQVFTRLDSSIDSVLDPQNMSTTMPTVKETAYRRDSGLPPSSSFTTSGLSPTEFSLGAALVLSRRHKHKKS